MSHLFDILFEASSSASSLSDFLCKNMQTVYDFHQSTHKHLVQSQASIDSYIQKKHSIISQLDFTNGYAKAFALMLLDDCERLNLIASAIRIHEILKNNNIEMNSRQQAALLLLYPKVNRNSEFIGRFDAVCQKLQYAIDMEEDDDKLSIAAFLNYLAIVALNTPTSCAEQIWEKLTLAVNSQQYPFLRNAYIVLLLGIDLQNGQEVHSYIQKSIDRLLEKQNEPTVLLPETELLIEADTDYAHTLQDTPPVFTAIRSLSLTNTSSTDLTNRGVKILESEAELADYMKRFGNMHRAKLEVAYNALPPAIPAPIHIIDWGCGQGFAGMLFIERFGRQGIRDVTLIEPSETAIRRAALHVRRYAPDLTLKTVCKKLDDVTHNDLPVRPEGSVVHLFSNILDIDDYSPSHLIETITSSLTGMNYFVCVSPYVDDIKAEAKPAPAKMKFEIVNGHLVADGKLLEGNRQEVTWWNGRTKYNAISKAKPHVTRFVPDQEGLGLTDRIDSTIVSMKRRGCVAFDHNYGLWYDLRRTDHERIRRRDGDVWAPLYEQPFGRSGQGKAWDGLSKYDLTRPNAWYWYRLKSFADKAETEGILLYHQNYFQHNILEAGAHWVDCPWRDANNINNTDMGEPVNFAGDKRIFVADKFYDENHPVRRELHRQYIRQCLDNFADNRNVIQFISAEYTGPLHFTEFWLDCIAEWEQETGKDALIALSATKDVQDAILADPKRAAVVDIIDIRYWHYRNDGSAYAPEGGKNMAPRQHARKMKVGSMGYAGAYKAVSEYRTKYPDKAVILTAQDYPAQGWAVLMGGGSCPVLHVEDDDFLADVPYMNVVPSETGDYEMIAGEKQGAVLNVHKAMDVPVSLPSGKYCVKYIHPKSCKVTVVAKSVKVKGDYTLHADKEGIYWLQKL